MLYTTIDGIQKEIEELSFDLNYGVKKRTSDLKYKKGDRNSRILITQFYDNDMPFNLQGYNVRMYAIKPDETKVFDDCEIIDHEYGTIKITLKEQMLNVAGTVQCEFVLTAADGSLMSTPVFKIIVQDSIHDTQAIESSNEFNALLNAIDTVDGLDNRMQVLKTETEQEIAKTNAQLSDLKKKIVNEKKNRLTKYRGYNFHYGDANWTPTLSRLYDIANEQISIGSNTNSCVIYIYINDADWNFTYTCDLSHIQEISKYLYKNGVTTSILKIHWLKGSYTGLDYTKPSSSFWGKLKNNIYDVLLPTLKDCGLEFISVTNELPDVTNQYNTPDCKVLLNNIINYTKDQNLKTIACFAGINDFAKANKEYVESLDAIGLNDYTAVSYKGIASSVSECSDFLKEYSQTKRFFDLPQDKPLFVTETGCMDYVDSLSSPEKWDYTDSQKIPSNDVIQNIYITSWLNYCDVEKRICGIYFWDSVFTGFRPTANTIKTLRERWCVDDI